MQRQAACALADDQRGVFQRWLHHGFCRHPHSQENIGGSAIGPCVAVNKLQSIFCSSLFLVSVVGRVSACGMDGR